MKITFYMKDCWVR